MIRIKRVEIAVEKVESGNLSLAMAAVYMDVTAKEITDEIARIEKKESAESEE